MHALKTDFNGNFNIGLFGFCTNRFCLLGKEVQKSKALELEKVLNVPVHQITICGTSLIGVFITGNSKTILVPSIAFDYEIEQLKRLDIAFSVINTNLTALGNNILCNDFGCVVNPDFSADQKKRIRQVLGVTVKPGTIAGLNCVGSLSVLNSSGCAVHRDIEADEAGFIEETLKTRCVPSTINMGSPWLRSGVICNDFGFAVGNASGGPEISNIEIELGFLEKNKRK
jgi:translation initiation factor 6